MAVAVTFILSVATAFAQGQYALLTHEGQTTVFRGADALINANNAATDGDLITLSEGQFTGTGIYKNITLRGSGMGVNGGKTTRLTVNDDINGQYEYFSLRVSSPDGGGMLIEDISYDGEGIVIQGGNRIDLVRCNTAVRFGADINSVQDMRIINCFINSSIDNSRGSDNKPQIIGSVIDGNASGVQAVNCVLEKKGDKSVFVNCILTKDRYFSSRKDITYDHCVIIYELDESYDNYFDSDYADLQEHAPDCKMFKKATPVFKEAGFYNLLDENATEWLGNDGTQVGIYGGNLPFDRASNVLSIKTLKVADKTDPEGILKLEVEIE